MQKEMNKKDTRKNMKKVLICFGLAKKKIKLPEIFIEIYHTYLKKQFIIKIKSLIYYNKSLEYLLKREVRKK